MVFETEDEGHRLRFEWVPIAGGALRQRNLLPRWMIEQLRELPSVPVHLIRHELP